MKHITIILAGVLFAWAVGFAVSHAIAAYDVNFQMQMTIIGFTAVLTASLIAFIVRLATT